LFYIRAQNARTTVYRYRRRCRARNVAFNPFTPEGNHEWTVTVRMHANGPGGRALLLHIDKMKDFPSPELKTKLALLGG
jgi:hypothetical protein